MKPEPAIVTLVPTGPLAGPNEVSFGTTLKLVARVDVQEGQGVAKGATLAVLSDPSAEGGIGAAEARVSEARANLAAVEAGGRPADYADLDSRQYETNVQVPDDELARVPLKAHRFHGEWNYSIAPRPTVD